MKITPRLRHLLLGSSLLAVASASGQTHLWDETDGSPWLGPDNWSTGIPTLGAPTLPGGNLLPLSFPSPLASPAPARISLIPTGGRFADTNTINTGKSNQGQRSSRPISPVGSASTSDTSKTTFNSTSPGETTTTTSSTPMLALSSPVPLGAESSTTINLDLNTDNSGVFTLASGDNTFSYTISGVQYLIVAGGGGGGGTTDSATNTPGGGGGAGGLLQGTDLSLTGLQNVTVGAGGAGGAGGSASGAKSGTSGNNSAAFGLTAIGGGGGGRYDSGGLTGGSGGGAGGRGSDTLTGASGTAGQGNKGGDRTAAGFAASGGGGAGGVGANAASSSRAGNGGAGLTLNITGSDVTYASGGGGGVNSGTAGTSQTGGNGGVNATGSNALANTGGGGGGGGRNNGGAKNGGSGGSGIVVIRYSGPQVLSGGDVSTVGGDTVHQFKTVGTSTLDLHSATIAGEVSGDGNLVWNKTGKLTLSGANSYTGSTTISSGTLEVQSTIASSSGITNNATLVFNSGSAQSFGNAIGGTGSLTKQGGGTLTLSGTNTYTGGTSINAGTLSFASGSLGTTGNITFTGDSTLQWAAGNTQDLSDRIVMGDGIESTLDSRNNDVVLAASFGGGTTGDLRKIGSGSFTITSAVTYTGGTFVDEGTLWINGSTASGSVVDVKALARIGGSGTIGGATTINGIHAPGNNGVGTQTFSSNLGYGAGSAFEWDLTQSSTSAGFDTVSASGNISVSTSDTEFKIVLGGSAATDIQNINNTFWNTPYGTQTWAMSSIFGKAFSSGAFQTVSTNIDVSSFGSFSIDGSNLTWTAIPEPSTALGGLLLTAGLLRRRRR
jgi:autotransporter-associated beta strand protein